MPRSLANSFRTLTTLALTLLGAAARAGDSDPDHQPPRVTYNEATRRLADGKLREAEAGLQAAVNSQNETVQLAALYNLGHVRFQAGMQEYTNAPEGRVVNTASQHADQTGTAALRALDDVAASEDIQALVTAYMQGRGARRELKSATEAVKSALEVYGAVLTKWRRATGDFKSTLELHPGDDDARFNAGVVDRWIAKVVDLMQPMMQSKEGMETKREDIRKKMENMKQKLPENVREQLKQSGGEEDEDEEEGKKPKEPKAGQREGPRKNGAEMQLTPEEALRLLGMLKLDADRKLPFGGNEETKPQNRKGRDW